MPGAGLASTPSGSSLRNSRHILLDGECGPTVVRYSYFLRKPRNPDSKFFKILCRPNKAHGSNGFGAGANNVLSLS